MLETLVRKFLYYPTRIAPDEPLPPYLAGANEVWIDAPSGGRIHGLYWPAPTGRPTILFFHGNAQTVFEWALIWEELAPLDCGLLLIDYPGYGKSSGSPSEAALYEAGHASRQWLVEAQRVPLDRVVIFGKSLGGGVSTEVAQGRDVLGVVLESTFTSIPAVMSNLLPLLPRGALLKSEVYPSGDKLPAIHAPVLIVHGTHDELIPVAEAHALYARANEPKQLFLVDGAGHNDVAWRAGENYGRTIRAWLDKITAPGNRRPSI
jgi:fermentation-respiration switch protein FrsA (DUF1100 family)